MLADWGRKGKVRRALNGKSIKDGFEHMDRELTTRIDDVVRRLEATEREKAAAFRESMAAREEEGANALKQLQAAAAAQQAALEDGAHGSEESAGEAAPATAAMLQ